MSANVTTLPVGDGSSIAAAAVPLPIEAAETDSATDAEAATEAAKEAEVAAEVADPSLACETLLMLRVCLLDLREGGGASAAESAGRGLEARPVCACDCCCPILD